MDHVTRYQRLLELGVVVNWDTILFGVLLKCVTTEEVCAFAQDRFGSSAHTDEHPEITQLAFDSQLGPEDVRRLLGGLASPMAPYEHDFGGGIALDRCTEPWRREGRKWRLLMLHECLSQDASNNDILDCVETVWATFLYPNDMRHLIRYVPANDALSRKSVHGGSASALIRGVRDFFAEERADLRARQ